MLWNASAINNYPVEASDGPIGIVSDFPFDDTHWTVRWLVVDTGRWLPGHKSDPPAIRPWPSGPCQRNLLRQADCAQTVEEAVKGVDAGAKVSVDLAGKAVSVDSPANAGSLLAAIRQAGYGGRDAERKHQDHF